MQMALREQGVQASAADINRADANRDGRIRFKDLCEMSGIS